MAGTFIGASTAAACARCARLPPNLVGSVSTDTAQAPPFAYACTRLSTPLVCADRLPAEGECSLHSARMSNPSGHNSRRGAGGASVTRLHNACSDSLERACSSRERLDWVIAVSRPDIEGL